MAELVDCTGLENRQGRKKKAKEQIQQQIEEGSARLIIGTHALIQDRITFQRLALVIVDEQHRFGVEQRLALRAKSHLAQPHQLMMSATPIPRTLAMTYFADLEVSSIDQLPPGRIPVTTKLIEQTRRHEVIDRLQGILQAGRQAYWVCPLIEEENEEKISSRKKSKEKLSLSLQAAVDTHTELTQALPHFRIGLIHGRMKSQEKSAVMMEFTQGTLDVLVATTVIEVGVDVPNASLMVIEHAERFGLAQLHQLRGRIGRGASRQTPVCLLLYQKPLSLIAKQRLQIMRESDDGFVIAQRDLQLRGPGEFLGQRQSGTALLRFADLTIDQELAQQACAAAIWMMRDYPDHVEPHLQRWLGCREHFLTT